MQERAEADATKQREVQERQASEHKARVKERMKKQEAKIRRAAEERLRREKAYQDLLSKTRECAACRFLRNVAEFPLIHERPRITLHCCPCNKAQPHGAELLCKGCPNDGRF